MKWILRPFRQRRRPPTPLTWEHMPRSPSGSEVFVDEAGRRHRADAPYLLPKDDKEIARLDYQHYILRQVLKGNSFVPVPVQTLLRKASTVLDVGCGTGRWGMEIAAAYPRAQVYGFDLEEALRPLAVPNNYQFHQGNLLHGLPFVSQTFDYVHQRLLVAAIPAEQWLWVIQELHRVTRSGGWVELVEMGNTFQQAGPATVQFLEWWVQIGATRGIDASRMAKLDTLLLETTRWKVIHSHTFLVPVGAWGGRVGTLLAQDMLAGWPTMKPLAHTVLGVSSDTFDDVMGRLTDEWNTFHTSYEVYAVCGQVREGKDRSSDEKNGEMV